MLNHKVLFWINLIFSIIFSCKTFQSKNDETKIISNFNARVKKEVWLRYRNFKCYDRCIRKIQVRKISFPCSLDKNVNDVKKIIHNFTDAVDAIRKHQPTILHTGYNFLIRSTQHNLDTCKSQKYTCGQNILYPKGSSDMRNITIICANKQYFISVKSTVNAKAWSVCCGAGYVPAVIESRSEFDCLKAFFASKKKIPNSFLLSAVDLNLTRNFVSCPTNSKVPADIWAAGQPDNSGGMEPCTYVSLCHTCNNAGLHDAPCLTNFPVLCQKLITADENAEVDSEAAGDEEVTPE